MLFSTVLLGAGFQLTHARRAPRHFSSLQRLVGAIFNLSLCLSLVSLGKGLCSCLAPKFLWLLPGHSLITSGSGGQQGYSQVPHTITNGEVFFNQLSSTGHITRTPDTATQSFCERSLLACLHSFGLRGRLPIKQRPKFYYSLLQDLARVNTIFTLPSALSGVTSTSEKGAVFLSDAFWLPPICYLDNWILGVQRDLCSQVQWDGSKRFGKHTWE